MRPEMIVFPDAAALADRTAHWLVEALSNRASHRPVVRLALSGGSTPRALYRRLASRDGGSVPWERVAIYWGDERAVPPEDEASNYRMAREALLDHVPIPSSQVHRIEGERADAASRYEALLRAEAAERGGPVDITLLGMGRDGHCASLFPGSDELESERWVVSTTSPEPPAARISMSLAAIARTPLVVVLVSGEAKAERLAEVLSEIDRGTPTLPLSRVQPQERLLWMLDEAAAGRLPPRIA